MSIELLDYQEESIENIFGNEDDKAGLFQRKKRSAAVVLPTGGGKSFVAMRAIEKMIELKNPATKDEKHPASISLFKMHYFAPNTGILYQFRLHIAEHMILNHYYDQANSENKLGNDVIKNIEYILSKIFPKNYKNIEFNGIYNKIIEKKSISTDNEIITKQVIKEIIKSLSINELTNLVKEKYPNIKFECYQNLSNMDINSIESDFFIFDEAHRAAAPEWEKQLDKLVNKNKNRSHFLSITATPDRNNDKKSIIRKVATKTGYTSDEMTKRRYFAKEYYLLEAIRDGRVIAPKVIGFPCTLDESPEYKNLLQQIEETRKDIHNRTKRKQAEEKLYALEIIKNKMDEIIGKRVNGVNLSEKEWEEKKQKQISESLNKYYKHDRKIYFIYSKFYKYSINK